MNKIKILMAGSSLKVKGGMSTVVESYLEHFSDANKFELKYIPTHVDGNPIIKSLCFIIGFLKILFYLKFGGFNIIHLHMSERGSFHRKFFLQKVAKILNKKVIIHTHGAEFKEFYTNSNTGLKKSIRKLLLEADIVIALGENWCKIITEIEPNANVVILRNAVTIPNVKSSLNNTPLRVLFLAVITHRKGIMDFINAIIPLLKQSMDIKVSIAGSGPLLEESKKLVKREGFEKDFHFLGWIGPETKQDLFCNSDLYVLPSYNEGLPLSILEAMSFGVPVIATNVGSINEAVINGRNGFLINAGDVQALSDSISTFYTVSNIQDYGDESRKIAERKFNSFEYFNTIEKIYEGLGKKKDDQKQT